MPPDKRPGGGANRLNHRLNSKCIQFEQQVVSGRKRQRATPGPRESICHVVAASAALSRMHVKDSDVPSSLIPFLQTHLCDSQCALHPPTPPSDKQTDQAPSAPESCKRIFWLTLDLSENTLGNVGISALVAWLISRIDQVRLRSLKLYRNSVGDEGAARLAELIRASPWPVEEIHLSHNRLGDVGVEVFMEAFIHARRSGAREECCAPNAKAGVSDYVYPRCDPQRSLLLPVWVRLEYNYVTQVDNLLARLRTALVSARGGPTGGSGIACFAEKSGLCVKDPNCSPKRCAKASATFGPLFHLYSFSHQMRPAAKPITGQAESPPPRRLSPIGLASSEPCNAATLFKGPAERRHSAAEIYTDSSPNRGESWTSSAPVYIFPDVPTCVALSQSSERPLCWSCLLNSRVSCEDLIVCLSSMSCEALKDRIDFRTFSALSQAGVIRMADELPAAPEFFARAVDLDQMMGATFARSAADVVRTVMALSVPSGASIMVLVEEHALQGVQQVLSSFDSANPPIAVLTAAALHQEVPDEVSRQRLQAVVQRHCVNSPQEASPPSSANKLRQHSTSYNRQDQIRTPNAALSRTFTEDMKQTEMSRSNERHQAPYSLKYESYIANLTRDMLDETLASISDLQRVNDQLIAWRRGMELDSQEPAPSVEASADGCLASVQQLLNRWDLLRSRLASASMPYAPAGSSASEATAAETHVCAHEGMLTTQSPAYFTQLVSRLNSLIDSKF